MRRALAGALLALLTIVALAGPAAAHAEMTSTAPAAGEVLDEAPDAAVVRFNEGVEATADAVRVFDAGGERVVTGELRTADGGRTLEVALGDLDDGGYVLTWRVVSLDGHPISGGVSFRVGEGDAVDPTLVEELLSAEGGDTTVSAVAAVVRGLLFAALVLVVGGLAFVALAWPAGAGDRRLRAALLVSAAVAVVTTLLGVGVQGADVTGQGLGAIVDPGPFGDVLDTAYGQWALVRLLPLALLAALVLRLGAATTRWWRVAAAAASATALLTVSMAGHARTGRWSGLAVPLDVVHLLAAATWIGGLAVLVVVALPKLTEAPVVRRFSDVAAVAVGLVVVTGTVQGLRQLDGLDGLRETTYGRLLAIKVAAVAVLVVLGAMSRSLVRADVDAEGADPQVVRRALRRSVGLETLVAVAVIGVTSLLVAADPGSRVGGGEGFAAQKAVAGSTIEVAMAPASAGPVDVHVYFSDPSLGLTPELDAAATLTLTGSDIPPVTVPVRPAGAKHWSAYDFDLPIKGVWRLDVVITVNRFETRETSFQIKVD